MGTWSAGNFENDGALDFVGDLVDQLIEGIERCFEESGADLDEEGEAVLVPSVEIISLLCERCNAAPPDPEAVKSWKEEYLEIYDAQIDQLDPDPDYQVERRRTIEQTFDRLLEQSRKFWEKALK